MSFCEWFFGPPCSCSYSENKSAVDACKKHNLSQGTFITVMGTDSWEKVWIPKGYYYDDEYGVSKIETDDW